MIRLTLVRCQAGPAANGANTAAKMTENATKSVQAAEFRRACSRFATGIAVATTSGPGGEPHGLTVNSFTSVSLEPPIVLVCVDYRCNILQHFRAHSHFGINILAADQQALSARFAERVGDRFDGIGWRRGETSGVPLLAGSLALFECKVSQIVESGDHAVFFGEVLAVEAADGDPLLYFCGRYAGLG